MKARQAFTLVELLVVIASIAILAAMLLPVLSRSKQQAQGTQCLSNTKQLLLAWTVYATDFREVLAYNVSYTNATAGGWVDGKLSDDSDNPDNTNSILMMSGQLGAYTKNAGLYQCPADPTHRVRSYSMDFTVGDKSTNGEQWVLNDDYWPNFLKMGDFKIPAVTWVFSDEHPDSINDGLQLTPDADKDTMNWADVAASYHNNAAGFAFADGHEEIHKWQDPSTLHPIEGNNAWLPLQDDPPNYNDIRWVESRCSPQLNSTNAGQSPG